MTVSPTTRRNYWHCRPPVTAGLLMALAAAAFAVVSVVHFGVDIPLGFSTVSDSFPGAAPPEAVIAAVVAVGAMSVLTGRSNSRGVGLATTSFALLGTVYGLTVTLNSARSGDVISHFGILAMLVFTLGITLLPGRRDARPPRRR